MWPVKFSTYQISFWSPISTPEGSPAPTVSKMFSSSSTPSLALEASLRRMVAISLSQMPRSSMGSAFTTAPLGLRVTMAETETPFSLEPTSSMGVWGWAWPQSGHTPEMLSSEVAV